MTLTDPEMRRFFMTVPAAAQLVLEAAARAEGGEVFVLRMKSVRIADLCEVMIEELAPKYGHKPEDIAIRTIGVTPGEKRDEDLLTDSEQACACLLTDDLGVVIPRQRLDEFDGERIQNFNGFITSANTLSKEDLRQYLKEEGYLT